MELLPVGRTTGKIRRSASARGASRDSKDREQGGRSSSSNSRSRRSSNRNSENGNDSSSNSNSARPSSKRALPTSLPPPIRSVSIGNNDITAVGTTASLPGAKLVAQESGGSLRPAQVVSSSSSAGRPPLAAGSGIATARERTKTAEAPIFGQALASSRSRASSADVISSSCATRTTTGASSRHTSRDSDLGAPDLPPDVLQLLRRSSSSSSSSSCPFSSAAPGLAGSRRQRPRSAGQCRSAREMHDAELGLLKARYDLKLDVERVRTNLGVQELREACDKVESQRKAKVQEYLFEVKTSYEESAVAERAAHEVQLKSLRLELENEYRGAIQSLKEEVAQQKEQFESLSKELERVQDHAARTERALRQDFLARNEALQQELQAVQAQRDEDRETWKAQETELRTVLTQELVSRFQREHFELTAKFSKETAIPWAEGRLEEPNRKQRRRTLRSTSVPLRTIFERRPAVSRSTSSSGRDGRSKAEGERDRLRSALAELQSSTRDCLEGVENDEKKEEEDLTKANPTFQTADQSVQTDDVATSDEQHEQLEEMLLQAEVRAMESADKDAQIARLRENQASDCEEVLRRLQRVVALKNEMIDDLKTELGRREEEALEAQAILRGLLERER